MKLQNEAEKFRAFIVKRSWLCGPKGLVNKSAYASLKARDGSFWRNLTTPQRAYLLGFVDGWNQIRRQS